MGTGRKQKKSGDLYQKTAVFLKKEILKKIQIGLIQMCMAALDPFYTKPKAADLLSLRRHGWYTHPFPESTGEPRYCNSKKRPEAVESALKSFHARE